ncbi:MAG TPA: neutral/alkaline non-lysosomal ceramidase N-terminal domain-containing protein [Actinomycetota bacterium]
MFRRRLASSLVALVAIAGGLTASARSTPELLEDGTWARAGHAPVPLEHTGPVQAGAATGDITPPPGAPMTGFYVARHCGVTAAGEPALETQDWMREIEEDPTSAPYAPGQCLAQRAGPDTDFYAKTFPAAEGRFGRLRANAFVIDDGERKVAIVSVDLPGFFGEMHEAVAHRIASTGITRENLLVSASHTHTGPGGYFQQNLGWALLGGDVLDPRIFEAITTGIADAVLSADARLQPAQLAAGETLIEGANGNRRGSQWELNPEAILEIDPRNAPRLGMIRIDAADGTPIGVITNFSTHGTIGNTFNMWHTGDDKAWVGRFVEQGIRDDAGLPREHPIVDATLNGAQGDIGSGGCSRPWDSLDGSDFDDLSCMESAGARQAPHYLDLWRSLGEQLRDDVTVDARFDHVCFCGQEVPDDPYDPFDRGEWVPENDDPAYFNVAQIAIQGEGKAPVTLSPGHHRRTPTLLGPPGVSPKNVRIQVLRVGDTAFATIPGEPTITTGRRIERSVKAAFAGMVERVWATGLANDHNAYYATIQEYEAYQYEGGWSFYGQQSGNLIKWRLVQLAQWMALGEPVPACTEERFCVENPDTSDLTADPEPLLPDIGAGEVIAQPSDVARFTGTSFTWWGGGPGAEWRPGEKIVSLQLLDGEDWVEVASDLDPVIPLRYQKRYGRHWFQAMFDPTAAQPLGTYRFVVTGEYATGPSETAPYTITSEPFAVGSYDGLTVSSLGDGVYGVRHPSPDRLRNFRFRPLDAIGWEITGTLNGDPFSATAPFALAAGDELIVPAGGITDASGNTNAAQVVITG